MSEETEVVSQDSAAAHAEVASALNDAQAYLNAATRVLESLAPHLNKRVGKMVEEINKLRATLNAKYVRDGHPVKTPYYQ